MFHRGSFESTSPCPPQTPSAPCLRKTLGSSLWTGAVKVNKKKSLREKYRWPDVLCHSPSSPTFTWCAPTPNSIIPSANSNCTTGLIRSLVGHPLTSPSQAGGSTPAAVASSDTDSNTSYTPALPTCTYVHTYVHMHVRTHADTT